MDVFNATRRNDCKALQRLLHFGCSPNASHEKSGKTPLHMACTLGNLSSLQLLLQRGADPNLQDKKGNSAVHTAILANTDIKVLELLLERTGTTTTGTKTTGTTTPSAAASTTSVIQCKVNVQNLRGHSPLLLAVSVGNNAAVDLLLEHGADVNLCSRDGKSSLMLACMNKNPSVCSSLIDKGADILARDHNGKDILHYAVLGGNLEIYLKVESLLAKRDFDYCDYSESLLVASQKGFALILGYLIDKLPCDINYITELRQSALHIAVQGKHKKTVRVLLEKGVSVDRRDHGILGANTALIIAAKNNMCSIIKTLLNAGADLEKTNVEQKTPMYYAAERGYIEATNILLAAIQDKTLKNKDQGDNQCAQVIFQSPLEAAVINGHTKLVSLLLERKRLL